VPFIKNGGVKWVTESVFGPSRIEKTTFFHKKIKKIKKKLWPKNPRNPAFFLLTWGKNETFLKLFSKKRLTFERFEHILCRLSS